MYDFRVAFSKLRSIFKREAAGPDTDIAFFNALPVLPNPDPILRAMGVAERVYASILADAHVIGEVRSIRGSFRDMNYRIVTWDEKNARAEAARELCEEWMQRTTPNAVAGWLETMWQMTAAIFSGYRVHELVWDSVDGNILPVTLVDRPNRRVVFDVYGEPLVVSRENPLGASVEPYRVIVSRHMASMTNPYGIALLSSCFWPWTFKTGGFKYFVRYCERHGLPWPLGRYPVGTSEADQNELARAIENMIDSGYAVVQEGNGIELLVPQGTGSGTLPQEALVNLCNREMSKALTGQAMVAELQGTGARAASETAQDRSSSIHDFDRDIAAESFGRIFRWITTFNFGADVPAPELEFFKPEAAGKERAETYEVATRLGAKPSAAALLEELKIPAARDEKDALTIYQGMTGMQYLAGTRGRIFSATASGTTVEVDREIAQADAAAAAADAALEQTILEPVVRMMQQAEKDGRTLADVRASLKQVLGNLDNSDLDDVTRKALAISFVAGDTGKGTSDGS